MRETIGIFRLYSRNDGVRLAEVRLPSPHLKQFKTRMLLGIKHHEYLLPNAWFDEVNRSYPYVEAPVDVTSIKVEALYGGFRNVTFTTE